SESEREYGEALFRVVSSAQFPFTSAMLASGAVGSDSNSGGESDPDFVDGLEVILDGLAVRIANALG
ncbi:MAG: TetR/AcrR family transcriptional regulator, partial [Brevibacterium aurantiacum]